MCDEKHKLEKRSILFFIFFIHAALISTNAGTGAVHSQRAAWWAHETVGALPVNAHTDERCASLPGFRQVRFYFTLM